MLSQASKTEEKQSRPTIYSRHIDVIESAATLSSAELCKKIDELDLLFNVDFPEKEGNNLFRAVLENKEMDNTTKHKTLNRLCSKLGYDKYAYHMLTLPLLEVLSDPEFDMLLKRTYLLNHNRIDTPDIEKKIWGILLKNNGDKFFKDMLRCINPEKNIGFIKFWLSTIHNIHDVITLNDNIAKSLPSHEWTERDIAYIKKLSQLRILCILREEKTINKEDKEAKDFLQSTEPHLFHLFKKHDSAYDIYKLIRDNKLEAADKEYIAKSDRAGKKLTERFKVSYSDLDDGCELEDCFPCC